MLEFFDSVLFCIMDSSSKRRKKGGDIMRITFDCLHLNILQMLIRCFSTLNLFKMCLLLNTLVRFFSNLGHDLFSLREWVWFQGNTIYVRCLFFVVGKEKYRMFISSIKKVFKENQVKELRCTSFGLFITSIHKRFI